MFSLSLRQPFSDASRVILARRQEREADLAAIDPDAILAASYLKRSVAKPDDSDLLAIDPDAILSASRRRRLVNV